jgi:hypothetical protein
VNENAFFDASKLSQPVVKQIGAAPVLPSVAELADGYTDLASPGQKIKHTHSTNYHGQSAQAQPTLAHTINNVVTVCLFVCDEIPDERVRDERQFGAGHCWGIRMSCHEEGTRLRAPRDMIMHA